MDGTASGAVPLRIVPDLDDPDCAQVLVEAMVAGVKLWFVLDSGARRSALAPSRLIDCLPRSGAETSGGVFGSVSSELVRVPELCLGSLRLTNADLTVGVGGDPRGEPDLRNLLGMDLLSLGRWELRFSEEMMCIDPPASDAVGFPMVNTAAGHICMQARVDGVSAACVWDTGAGITVVDARFAGAHPELFTMLGTGTGTDSNLASIQTPLAMLTSCQIGETRFAPSKVAIVDLNPAVSTERRIDLILGYPILRQADWRIDVPGRTWWVTRR